MKKLLFLIILSFSLFNGVSSQELDCNNLNDCLSKNYTIKDKGTFKIDVGTIAVLYELEKKREKTVIHCTATYVLEANRMLSIIKDNKANCFKP
tara:strand:- start:277 stop:558 length:282 start_codon:yes stop_codon:yes gene_type:complete